jgi:hypothetical protein
MTSDANLPLTEWRLVPVTLTPKMRDALLACESGEFSVQGGWDYILASAPQPQPVAWVDDLSLPQPHCVTDLKYCTTYQHEHGLHLKYTPVYAAKR